MPIASAPAPIAGCSDAKLKTSAAEKNARERAAIRNDKFPSPEVQSGGTLARGSFDLVNETSLAAPRLFKRLRRVDVEEGSPAFDSDIRHRFGMFQDQLSRADIAVQRHQFRKEATRP